MNLLTTQRAADAAAQCAKIRDPKLCMVAMLLAFSRLGLRFLTPHRWTRPKLPLLDGMTAASASASEKSSHKFAGPRTCQGHSWMERISALLSVSTSLDVIMQGLAHQAVPRLSRGTARQAWPDVG